MSTPPANLPSVSDHPAVQMSSHVWVFPSGGLCCSIFFWWLLSRNRDPSCRNKTFGEESPCLKRLITPADVCWCFLCWLALERLLMVGSIGDGISSPSKPSLTLTGALMPQQSCRDLQQSRATEHLSVGTFTNRRTQSVGDWDRRRPVTVRDAICFPIFLNWHFIYQKMGF